MLTARIKDKAFDLGIDKIGIVRAEALSVEGERLNRWLSGGLHGNMAWMEREHEKRADPQLLFSGAKSVVVAAVNYFTPYKHEDSDNSGKISRYAWGDDYHDLVTAKLTKLLDWIKTEIPDAEGKVCVDTSPVMEKAWAVRAGLGWLGKHSNVITPEFGSWVFIGEILLNAKLDYESDIIPDHCGTCTMCLEACPTGAIVEPYVVDSRKCISYATIELRDEKPPREIAENLNGWLYGCDICQDVCPWNRFEKSCNEPAFEPRNGETSLDLSEVSSMEYDQYVERFRCSAMKRTKLTGLKRNAAAISDKVK